MPAQELAPLARAYRADPSPAHHAAVLQFAGSHKDTAGALAYLALGSKEVEQGEFDDALKHLDIAARRLPGIPDYPAYLDAATRFELARYDDLEHALKPVWDRAAERPGSPLVAKAAILLANGYLKQNLPKKAIEIVERHLTDLRPVESEILLAHAYELQGATTLAVAHYQRILVDFPMSKEADDAASDPDRLASLTPKARLNRALRLLDGNDGARAKVELEKAIPRLAGVDRDAAAVKLGAAHVTTTAYAAALSYLSALRVQDAEADAERLFWMARCVRRLDRVQDFPPILERLAAEHPTSRWRLKALLSTGDFWWAQNAVAQYEPVYRSCVAAFPADPAASECQWRMTWSDYLQRRPVAEAEFQVLIKRYPGADQVATSLYFLGRIAESRMEWPEARAYYERIDSVYPNYFYATLARDRMKSPVIARATSSPEVVAALNAVAFPKRPAVNYSANALSASRFERAKLLTLAGLDDLADSELRFGAKKDGQPEVVAIELASLAIERDQPELAIRAIKQFAPLYLRTPVEAAPEQFWKYAYPLPFRGPLEQFCRAHGLEPFLVAALIRQESEFNTRVVSHANAYGLTQLLPSTAREIARKLNMNMKAFRSDTLFQPEVNLQIGTYFLRSLLDRLEGRWEAVLASYNAGPARAAKWLTWGKFREPAEFIETIPFDETRGYVQSVLRNADMYRRLYGTKTVALASSDGDKNAHAAGGNRKPAAAIPK